MEKQIGQYTVNVNVNLSLVKVYDGAELISGISVIPNKLKEKFDQIVLAVERRVELENKAK